MANFNKSSKSGRPKSFGKRTGRDSGRPAMHHATCNNCGKDCEVPFKPTGGKPIYCSSCFDKSQHDGPKKYGRERSDRNFKSGDSRKRSFGNTNENDTDQLKKEFEILNKKLDNILEILTPLLSEENYQDELDDEIEEPKPKRKTKKKL